MFSKADVSFSFPEKKRLKAFLNEIFVKEKKTLIKLHYVFCSDEYLLEINLKFLNHHFYTDIITFNLSETHSIEGEIYISIDRVKENALNLDQPFQIEMLRVIFHGALHLCGYKDKKKSEIVEMRKMEDVYLRLYNKFK